MIARKHSLQKTHTCAEDELLSCLFGCGVGRFIRICPYINVAPKLPNVNIQIDPFATLVPKCQYSDRSICNIGTQITKCQYSDRSICNIGTQMSIFGYQCCKWIWLNIIHLAGAAIRTRNHNYEDRNYDLNAHPQIARSIGSSSGLQGEIEVQCVGTAYSGWDNNHPLNLMARCCRMELGVLGRFPQHLHSCRLSPKQDVGK